MTPAAKTGLAVAFGVFVGGSGAGALLLYLQASGQSAQPAASQGTSPRVIEYRPVDPRLLPGASDDFGYPEVALPRPQPGDASSHARETEQEAGERLDREQAELKQRFTQEGRDDAWASAAESSFRTELARDRFERDGMVPPHTLIDVRCKSTLCAAVLEWSSYEQATRSYTEVLHGTYSVNCQRALLLKEPSSGGKYQATAYFDCEMSRTN